MNEAITLEDALAGNPEEQNGENETPVEEEIIIGGTTGKNPRSDKERVSAEVRRANQAEGTKRSWEKEETRIKRTTRRACTVSFEGGEPVYFSSVAAAFQKYGFPMGAHYGLRAELRSVEGNEITYLFEPSIGMENCAEPGAYLFKDVEFVKVEKPKKEKKAPVEGEAKPKREKKAKKAKPTTEEPVLETVDVEPTFD